MTTLRNILHVFLHAGSGQGTEQTEPWLGSSEGVASRKKDYLCNAMKSWKVFKDQLPEAQRLCIISGTSKEPTAIQSLKWGASGAQDFRLLLCFPKPFHAHRNTWWITNFFFQLPSLEAGPQRRKGKGKFPRAELGQRAELYDLWHITPFIYPVLFFSGISYVSLRFAVNRTQDRAHAFDYW